MEKDVVLQNAVEAGVSTVWQAVITLALMGLHFICGSAVVFYFRSLGDPQAAIALFLVYPLLAFPAGVLCPLILREKTLSAFCVIFSILGLFLVLAMQMDDIEEDKVIALFLQLAAITFVAGFSLFVSFAISSNYLNRNRHK